MTNLINKLREERNKIVMESNDQMEPLREQRRNGEEIDWNLWDSIEKEMQIEVSKIDMQLWDLGQEV